MVSAVSTKELREKRMKIATDMRQMIADTNGKLTPEQDAQFNKMDEEQNELLATISRLERMDEIDAHLGEVRQQELRDAFRPNPKTAPTDEPTREEWDMARRAFFMGNRAPERFRQAAEKCGIANEREWHVQLMRRAPRNLKELHDLDMENLVTRATTTAQTVTTTAGGHVIQNEAMREIEIALLAAGGMRECGAEIYRTGTGATLPIPTVNDTTQKSVVLAINTAADVEAFVFGQKTLAAFKYSTGIVLVPMELMQDTTVPIPSLVGRLFGERAVKGTNLHFTVGATDGNQPTGIVLEAIAGTTSSDVNTLTYGNLVDQEHSINPAYRRDTTCGWMMHDDTLKVVKKLTDGQSRPLWLPAMSGLAGGFADRLLGYPITINQDMAAIASATTGAGAAKAILFGAFNRFKIRDVADLRILRLDERYAEKAQTAFIGFHRHDSGAVIASTVTPPFKYLISKAT